MIYLGGPSLFINGLVVLPDYGNPRQFYYLPPPPRLAVDPGSGRKVFKLLKLVGGLTDPTGDGLHTGIVSFDCDLSLSREELQSLEDQLRDKLSLGTGPLSLTPIPYKDGEVACYILGEQSWPDNAPPERKNLFVERMQGFGKPSLYGDNRASFCARMTQEGASVLQASLRGGGPIGISIVYTLKFDALQPAFRFKVEAQWEQIYHYLEEKVGVDLFFIKNESTSIVEELEQHQLLRFEEVVYDAAASGDVQQLRKQLQQYILEKFFTPVLSAGEPKYNKIAGTISDIARSLVVVPTFGYSRKELSQTERRFLSFEASRISAIERVIYPQANLFALIPEAELPSYTQEVNTDADLFYRQLAVQCVLGGFDFGKSKIAWVHPYIRYGDAPEEGADKTLAAMSDTLSFKTWLQPRHGFRYRSGYEVEFFPADDNDPEAIYGQALKLRSPECSGTDRVLAINPRELFDQPSIEFVLKQGFPSDRYAAVLISLKYEDSAGYGVERSYRLGGATPSCTFRVRRPPGVEGVCRFRLQYYPTAGAPITTDWQIATESIVVIDDPFPQNFLVRVYVAEPKEELGWADISLRYEDPHLPGSYQEGRMFFDQDLKPQVWKVSAPDPRARRYQYRFTLFLKDSSQVETPDWIDADAPTLTIGRRVPMQRTVAVCVDSHSFDSEGLRDITVTLWPEGKPENRTELVFLPGSHGEPSEQKKEFTYRAGNAAQVGYAYEIFYRYKNGRTASINRTSATAELTLKVPSKAS